MAWIHRHEGPTGATTHVRWRDARGRRHSKTLGAVDDATAERERIRVEVLEEGKAPTRDELPPAEALERFLASLHVQGRRETTQGYYRKHLGRLFEAWAGTRMRDWSRGGLEAYLASHASWSPRSVQILLVVSRTFIRWTQDAGIECADFVGRLRGPKPDRKERRALSAEQLRKLLETSRGHPLEVPIHLATFAGLSLGDLRALTWSEVDLVGGWIQRPRRKTGVAMRLPIAPRLNEVLERKRALSGPVCREWPEGERRIYESLYRLHDVAGVPRGGWHTLRHSYATLLQSQGVDVSTIARLLGHRPGSSVTLRYLHSDDERVVAAAAAVEHALA